MSFAIEADFQAARLALEAHDIASLNVMANRLMSNVLFATREDRHCILIGFVLKDLAGDLDQRDLGDQERQALYDEAESLLDVLENFLPQAFEARDLWIAFAKYTNNWKLHAANQYERKAYKTNNVQLTKTIVRYAFETALTDSQSVFDPKSRVCEAVISELVRAFRTLGSESDDLLFYSLVVALQRIADYRRFQASRPSGFDEDLYKKTFEPSVQRVLGFYEKQKLDPSALYPDGSAILCDLILEWRQLFLRYFEIAKVAPETPRLELPAAAKERIVESVARAIEKDLSEKSGPSKK